MNILCSTTSSNWTNFFTIYIMPYEYNRVTKLFENFMAVVTL